MLEGNIPHYLQPNIYRLPSVSTLSDEDSDDEDSPKSINHLSGKLLSAPAEVVMRTQQEFKSSDNEA